MPRFCLPFALLTCLLGCRTVETRGGNATQWVGLDTPAPFYQDQILLIRSIENSISSIKKEKFQLCEGKPTLVDVVAFSPLSSDAAKIAESILRRQLVKKGCLAIGVEEFLKEEIQKGIRSGIGGSPPPGKMETATVKLVVYAWGWEVADVHTVQTEGLFILGRSEEIAAAIRSRAMVELQVMSSGKGTFTISEGTSNWAKIEGKALWPRHTLPTVDDPPPKSS